MNAFTKQKMDEDKKAYPEKYHHISGSKLSGFINEPCYWVSEGNSFRDIEKSVLQFYSFKNDIHIYYATPNELKKHLGIDRLGNTYFGSDCLFFFVKADDINEPEIKEKERSIQKLLNQNK